MVLDVFAKLIFLLFLFFFKISNSFFFLILFFFFKISNSFFSYMDIYEVDVAFLNNN